MKHIYYSQVCGSEATLFFVWGSNECTIKVYSLFMSRVWGKSALRGLFQLCRIQSLTSEAPVSLLFDVQGTHCAPRPLTWPAAFAVSSVVKGLLTCYSLTSLQDPPKGPDYPALHTPLLFSDSVLSSLVKYWLNHHHHYENGIASVGTNSVTVLIDN